MKRAFRGGARSETLKPDPVTELPLTPPAEEEEEEAAISSLVEFSLHSAVFALSPTAPPTGPAGAAALTTTRTAACSRPCCGGRGRGGAVPGDALPWTTSGFFASSLQGLYVKRRAPFFFTSFGVLFFFLLAFMILGL